MEETGQLSKQERRQLAKEEKRKERTRQEISAKVKKGIWGLLILGAVAFLGYKLVVYLKTPTSSVSQPLVLTDKDWIKGEKNAKLTLVEYADFECPACAAYAPFLERLSQDFPEELRITYREFPLPSHKKAYSAAQAAEAAGLQGKFWEMGSVLYQRQEEWGSSSNPKDKFVEYSRELGLSQDKFLADFDSQVVKDKINADILTGQKLRVAYTPSFYLDGKLVSPKSYEEFKSLVEKEIAK